MFPRVLCGVIFLRFLILCALGLAIVLAPEALAQHPSGHVGGPGIRVPAPPIPRPPISHPPVARPFSPVPPASAFRAGGNLLYRPGPFHPRPIFPIYGYPIYGYPFWGPQAQFWWLWAAWPYNSCAWTNCYSWSWIAPYDTFRFYEYPPPAYTYSLYLSSQERELPQLLLNDGTVLSVTDYWLVDNQVHFKIIEERSGRPVEQVIPLDALDLQTTVGVNTRRGFRFVLRDEAMDQYLEHHPNQPPPDWTSPHP